MFLTIILHHFMCYTNQTFTFDINNLHLISGVNGSGKSTILKAIYFALYGVGKNVYPFEELKSGERNRRCKVELFITSGRGGENGAKFEITRTKNPNRVVVKLYDNERNKTNDGNNELSESFTIYEDEAAQHIIDSLIGMDHNQFVLSSYIKPNSKASLITLPPAEQYKLFESLTFNNDVNITNKDKLNKLYTFKNESLIALSSKIELLSLQLDSELKSLNEEYDLNISKISDDKLNEIMISPLDENKIKSQITNLEKEVKEKSEKIYSLLNQNEERDIDKLKNDLRVKEMLLKKLLPLEKFKEVDYNELLSLKEKIKERKLIDEKLIEFEKLKQDYFDGLKNELTELSQYVLNDELRLKCEDFIKKYNHISAKIQIKKEMILKCQKDIFDDSLSMNELNELLLGCEKQLKENDDCIAHNKKLTRIKKCPNPACSVHLLINDTCDEYSLNLVDDELKNKKFLETKKIMSDKELEEVEFLTGVYQLQIEKIKEINELKSDIEKIKKELSDELLNSELSQFGLEIEDVIRKYENHLKYITKYTSVKKNLESQILNSQLIKIQKGIPLYILNFEIPSFIKIIFDNQSKKFDVNELDRLIKKVESYVNNKNEIETLKSEITNLQEVITFSTESSESENLINDLKNKEEQLNNLRNLHVDTINYKQFVHHQKKVDELKESLSNLKKEKEVCERECAAIILLQQKHHQAEILSIEDVVNTINELAKEYLEIFFEEPIDVKCNILKKTKNDIKFKVNTTINYKGHEYTSYEDLSQGELVKVNLSYILALNTYFNSNILMLDEFLENLDEEIKCEVVDNLKIISNPRGSDSDLGCGKCIIVIDHGANEGMYNNVTYVE